MNLSDDQKKQLQLWISERRSLGDIQKKLDKEWDLSITYMDLRFLIDDLQIDLPSEPEEKPGADPKPEASEEQNNPAASKVSVSVDKVMRPGTLVSGDVTFSDGATATWQLDPGGRIGLAASQEDYSPSKEDLQEFQAVLRTELQKAGFA